MINNLKNFLLRYKLICSIILCTFIVILILLFTMLSNNNSFALNINKYLLFGKNYTKENKLIEIETDNYDEPGSWHIDKSAKWISKDTAEITFDIDTKLMGKSTNKDVILVLDNSNSMEGDKINRLKTDIENLMYYLLHDNSNRLGIITFGSESVINSEITGDYDELLSIIRSIGTYGRTNYNAALLNVDEILENYTKEEDRDLIVLFLTDGYPDLGNPNQVAAYSMLKEKYPYIKINAVQYEMGDDVVKEVREISDNQWIGRTTSLGNVLFAASEANEIYEYFNISDYIDNEYFYVNDISDITISIGKVDIINDSDNQLVKWELGKLYLTTGSKAKMTIKVHLKDEYIDKEGFYSTNGINKIESKLIDKVENITNDDTPVLKNRFKVHYDSNMPSNCRNTVYDDEVYYVFDIVNKKTETLYCNGYLFGGWKIVESDVQITGTDTFIMPDHDVTIRAEWKKMKIEKTMDGTVHEKITLYKKIENDYDNNASNIVLYDGEGSSDYDNNVYIYTDNSDDNYVLFADYCWKMVRTTDTGGVKLLYNGKMINGSCANTGSSTVIGGTGYNISASAPGYIGYMYNRNNTSKYNLIKKEFIEKNELLKSIYTNANDEFYYADSVIYENGNYILDDNGSNYIWKDDYDNTIGKFTCRSSGKTCSKVYYVGDVDPCDTNSNGSNMHTFILENGNLIDDVKKTMYFASSFDENGLVDPIELSLEDYLISYNNYKNYYTCLDVYDKNCSDILYITSTSKHDYNYLNMSNNYVYGHDFEYIDGTYKLKDTVSFWDFPNEASTLGNRHYTCFNTTGECDTLYYIFYIDHPNKKYANYIPLVEGKSVDTAIDEMLNNSDVNKDNSSVKNVVDNWYKNNIDDKGYTSLLEDTVYCNDRSISSLGGWNKDSNNYANDPSGILFSTYNTTRGSLMCKNYYDRFTVSSEKGNGDLKYPVGLLTTDEVYLATKGVKDNYIGNNTSFYLMSSSAFYVDKQSAVYINGNGTFNTTGVLWYGFNARPVITLKSDIEYLYGTGISTNPYVIGV